MGGRLLDGMVAIVLGIVPFIWISADRPLARLLIGISLVAAYEAAFVAGTGSTPGKVIAGTRVVALDQPRVEAAIAIKRGLLAAASTAVIALAPLLLVTGLGAAPGDSAGAVFALLAIALVVSVFNSPLRRGLIDRLCDTLVVTRTTVVPARSLIGAEATTPVATETRWGPVATFGQRRKARLGRFDDAPFLVLGVFVIVFAISVPNPGSWVIVGLAVSWEFLFVADETWRVSRWGGSRAKRELGLAVVDLRSGEPPTAARSLVRAVLVSLPLYVLPFGIVVGGARIGNQPLMIVPLVICAALLLGSLAWLRLNHGRALHDVAARTAVVDLRRLNPTMA